MSTNFIFRPILYNNIPSSIARVRDIRLHQKDGMKLTSLKVIMWVFPSLLLYFKSISPICLHMTSSPFPIHSFSFVFHILYMFFFVFVIWCVAPVSPTHSCRSLVGQWQDIRTAPTTVEMFPNVFANPFLSLSVFLKWQSSSAWFVFLHHLHCLLVSLSQFYFIRCQFSGRRCLFSSTSQNICFNGLVFHSCGIALCIVFLWSIRSSVVFPLRYICIAPSIDSWFFR